MRVVITLLLGMLMAVTAAPVAAQLKPGTSGSSSAPRDAGSDQYWYLVRSMGDCLAENKTELAVAFLDSEIDSGAEDKAFGKLFGRVRNMCMRNFVSASFRRAHIRGSIAEGLYRQNMRQRGADFIPVVAAPEAIGSIHDFARCYIVSNFAETRDFLDDTKLNTSGETERLQELASGFQPCLPQDREVKLRPIVVRLALAEAMYHATKVTPLQAARERGGDDA